MANAVRAVTTERGLDPRDFTLIAYGGGGPPHALAVARELSIRTVIIPQAPAHFSAFGMLLADFRRDYVLTDLQRLADASMDQLEGSYQRLEQEGLSALEAAGLDTRQVTFQRAADMRYVGQEHAVAVPVPARIDQEAARQAIKDEFDRAHQVRFSHSAPEEPAELVSLRVSVFGSVPKPSLPRTESGAITPPPEARRADRAIVLDDSETAITCTVYDRLGLLAGNTIDGPAVIEEPASSTLLGPRDRATVNEYGQLVIELEGA
jgi:N-methylhydantoinase A